MSARPALILVGLLAVGVGALCPSPSSAGLPVVYVGEVYDGPASLTDEYGALIQKEIETLAAGEFEVRFEDRHRMVGDWTMASVEAAIDQLFADPEVDVVLALGSLSSHAFCCRRDLPKPVIAAVVADPKLQELPDVGGRSGVHNLNYLTFPSSVADDLRVFRSITPFHKVTVVFNRWFVEAVPRLELNFAEMVADEGFAVEIVEAGPSVDETLEHLRGAEAVYLAPLLHLSDADRRRLFDGLIALRLPSFSVFGASEVAEGVLAGQRDEAFFQRLARRVALNVQRVLLGEDPGQIPVTIPDSRKLTLNMATARAIGVAPPWEVLSEAVLFEEEPENLVEITLPDVVAEAIDANLDLLARRREVAAGEQDVAAARAILRPQVSAEVTGVQIDDDRASATLSTQAERTWTGGLEATQLVYSEPAGANVAIQRQLQLGREQQLAQLRLDIALDAVVAYVNVLRAKTFEHIRKDDLQLTRSNLDLARVRQSVGTAGPGEVFRWESSLATSRRELIEAQASRYQAEIALNRIVHQPLDRAFATRDVGIDDPRLITSHEEIYSYTGTPAHLRVFAQMVIAEGLARSPELAALDAAIAAQERGLASARRAFWSPQVALRLAVDHLLGESGEGAGDAPPALPFALRLPDDTNWSLALRTSLPLFSGGERRADVIAAEETLEQLRLERASLAEKLEQQMRSRLHDVRASYAGINLSAAADDAARRNLGLVTDAYSRGVIDVLDLLDAQNAALGADLAAADANYQFLIDLARFERSISQLDYLVDPETLRQFFARLDAHFREAGLEPRPRSDW